MLGHLLEKMKGAVTHSLMKAKELCLIFRKDWVLNSDWLGCVNCVEGEVVGNRIGGPHCGIIRLVLAI